MIKFFYNFIKSVYDVYLYKIIKYYEPIVEKLTINNEKVKKYNMFKNDNEEYIYKCLNVEYYKNMYYNLGLYYHTSPENLYLVIEKDIAILDDIDSLRITLLSNNNKEYTIIDEKFIGLILNFSTKQSKLKTLLYYYLQIYLSNFDKIIKVEFEIDNIYKEIDFNELLEYIN